MAPAIHQIELHPYFQQRELREVHERHGILTEAWGPLGQGKSDLLENPAVTSVAEAHGVSPAQAVLAWHLHTASSPSRSRSRPHGSWRTSPPST